MNMNIFFNVTRYNTISLRIEKLFKHSVIQIKERSIFSSMILSLFFRLIRAGDNLFQVLLDTTSHNHCLCTFSFDNKNI